MALAAEYSTPKHVKSSVSVWDRIVESKEDAHLVLPFVRNKYKLVDNGRRAERERPST